jgi:hypothetical protein
VCTATDLQNDGSIRVWNLEKFTLMRRQNCKIHENSTWTVPVASWHSARYPTRKKDKNHNKSWKTGLKCSPTLSGNTRFTGPLLLLGWIRLGRFVLVLCLVIKARRSAALLPWNHLSELNSKNAPAWSFFACLLTNLKVIVRIVLHDCCNNTWQNYEGHLFPRFLCLPVFPILSVVFCHRLCSSAAFRLHCFSFKCTIHVSRASEKRLPGSASHCLPNSVQIRQTMSQRQGNHLILLSPLSSPQT